MAHMFENKECTEYILKFIQEREVGNKTKEKEIEERDKERDGDNGWEELMEHPWVEGLDDDDEDEEDDEELMAWDGDGEGHGVSLYEGDKVKGSKRLSNGRHDETGIRRKKDSNDYYALFDSVYM
ncbi:hypothetical protein FPQ18DRAFT_387773 [Pyronema domesticum]|nr:hypothetical protein FPQ18DRAFT_387773 [Pyronema domesticum]